ncbi:MAG: hypothetical protein J6I68_11590 [Butyrivibrio sp.]|uniref:hypothetical protein n=1 Tax=Butyrivibrio sp. TaxID=28121 RepID=UPI001B689994|nr:hypothetical protein [Butyrivibrio sp.]MBP3783879.1 hypothetical protein [Butyrivibrio sp.]
MLKKKDHKSRQIHKILPLALAIVLVMPLLTGCTNIIERKKNKYAQVQLTKEELKDDVYYIKNGTKFVQVYKAQTYNVTSTESGRNKKTVFLGLDFETVPTLYKGEIIALATKSTAFKKVEIIRYETIGYTLGMFGLKKNEDTGTLDLSTDQNLAEDSNVYKTLRKKTYSTSLQLVSINNQPVSESMINDTGIFDCLEENGIYTLEYYSGTKLSSSQLQADMFALQEFEYYEINEADNTANGYFALSLPEDAKSGYYYIEGAGMFKYIADKKGTNELDISMNEPYYSDEYSAEDAYAQKYSVEFDVRMANVTINLNYDSTSINDIESITGKAVSPDGTEYSLNVDYSKSLITISLLEAMAGKWNIYIQPKDIAITKANIVSSANQQEITQETYNFAFDEAQENTQFVVKYKTSVNSKDKDPEIYALLVFPDGTTQELKHEAKNKVLYSNVPYINGGSYVVKVYHYTDTEIDTVTTETGDLSYDEDTIITVTE